MLNISRKDIKSDTFDNKKNALRSKITPGNNHNVFFTWELIPSKSSIISFSSGIEAVTGYSGKEINNLAKGIESLIVDDDCAKLKKEYNTFLKDPSTNRLIRDYGITCKDGSSKWIWEEIIADRTKTGKVKSLSGFAFDITPARLITGFITERGICQATEKDIKKTIRFAKSLGLKRAAFSNFLPLPGTEIYKNLIRSGEIKEEEINWEMLFHTDVPYSPSSISKKRLKNLQRRAYIEFNLRPEVLFNILKEIKTLEQVKFLFRRFISVFSG